MFSVPSGSSAKSFVRELVKLLSMFNDEMPWKSIALTALFTFPILMLRKPGPQSTAKENASCLERRLVAWNAGDVDVLVREGRTLQQLMPSTGLRGSQEDTEDQMKRFCQFDQQWKNEAWSSSSVARQNLHRVMPLSAQVRDGATVLDVLKEKHPESQPAHENALLSVQNENPDFHPITFNQITPEAV